MVKPCASGDPCPALRRTAADRNGAYDRKVNMTHSTSNSITPKVVVTSDFWHSRRRMVADSALPYQWRALNDEVPVDVPEGASWGENGAQYSHSLRNLRIAAGREQGAFSGQPFQDTDVSKWLESASYALRFKAENIDVDRLEASVDEAVSLFEEAQDQDGYIDTKFEIDVDASQRFRGLRWSHELYTMGHFIEAAVAHYEATGSERALNVARRAAACIASHFGDEEGKVHGPDGHPEIELALARLYEATGERQWLELAAWFIRVRGTNPEFWDQQDAAGGPQFYKNLDMPISYFVADKPALDLTEAEGHAVRFLYLATAMAKVGHLLDDDKLKTTAVKLWRNIVEHRMYVTGGVGSTQVGEAFTYDDDLPNDLVYAETCASVSMVFFAQALMSIEPDGSMGDVIERELYNGALSGIQLDGKRYFYVNPLDADPVASRRCPTKAHVLTRRAGWFDCACCPANLTRLIASVDRYLYSVGEGEHEGVIYAHQFIANRTEFGDDLVVEQRQKGEGYPWNGDVTFAVDNPRGLDRTLAIRIPGWCASWKLSVNGRQVSPAVEHGFVFIDVSAARTDIALRLDMPVRVLRAATRVREDFGKVALMRGPIVYCMEGCDNRDGDLWLDQIDTDRPVEESWQGDLLGGVVRLTAHGTRVDKQTDTPLYMSDAAKPAEIPTDLVFVPYYAWCNREEGQMQVWVRER